MSRRSDRHAARRARRRATAPARLLIGSLGAAGAIVLGVLAGGGTFAVWTAAAPAASAVTLQAGSAGLEATALDLAATGLYPGRTVFAATTVRNSGTTPLALTLDPIAGPVTPTDFSSALVVSVGLASSPAECTEGRTAAAATTTASNGTATDLRLTLEARASTLLCIGIGLPASAPAAAAGAPVTPLTLTLIGTQVLA